MNVFKMLASTKSNAAVAMFAQLTTEYDSRTNEVMLYTADLKPSQRVVHSRTLQKLIRVNLVKRVRSNTKSSPGVLMLNPRVMVPPGKELPKIIIDKWDKLK